LQSGGPQPRQARARRALFCALVAGLAFIVVPGALAAADDDPGPTPPATTTPVPEPTPDPAPPVAPKPKPASKPPATSHANQTSAAGRSPSRPTHAPAPARRPALAPVHTQPRVYHARTIRRPQPVTSTRRHARPPPIARHKPAVRRKHRSKAPKRKHSRAKHKAHRAARLAKKPTAAHTTVVPTPQPRSAAAASLLLPTPARPGSGGPTGLASILIVLGLLGAIACFILALVPATYLRWRPAAVFASERHLDLTVAGVALLAISACMLVLGRIA
jgi:hypothetical protein